MSGEQFLPLLLQPYVDSSVPKHWVKMTLTVIGIWQCIPYLLVDLSHFVWQEESRLGFKAGECFIEVDLRVIAWNIARYEEMTFAPIRPKSGVLVSPAMSCASSDSEMSQSRCHLPPYFAAKSRTMS